MAELDPVALARVARCLDGSACPGHVPWIERGPALGLALWCGAASRDVGSARPSFLVARALPRTARRRLDLELRRAGVVGRMGRRRRIDRAAADGPAGARRVLLEACLHRPSTRLAVYGTLRPGASNHRQLAGIEGTWRRGRVHGRLATIRLGEDRGLPALVPGRAAATVDVEVLTSDRLPAHWARLDDFEGSTYRRVALPVLLDDGRLRVAWVYAAAHDVDTVVGSGVAT